MQVYRRGLKKMYKRREINQERAREVLTSVNLPIEVLQQIKMRGLNIKQCVLTGFENIIKGNGANERIKEMEREIDAYQGKIERLIGKVSELSNAMYGYGLDPFNVYTKEQREKIKEALEK